VQASNAHCIGTWAWNIRTRALYWSAEHFRICGLEPGSMQLSFEAFMDIVHPDDRAKVSRVFTQAVRERAEYKCRYRIVRPDRCVRELQAVARPVLDESGEPVQFVGTVLDVTEELRAAALLNRTEQRFASMLDSITHHVWSRREDGTLSYSNQQFRNYIGASAAELRSRGRRDLHPEDVEKVEHAWRDAFASGAPYEMEQRMRRRDGTYRRFLSRAIPIYESDGSIAEYFGTDTDVEELRRSDEALRATQADLARMSRVAMLGELSASLAHELNQPLAAIIANCDASLRWQRFVPPNLDEMGVSVERIRRDAQRASAVLGRIRAFLRKAEPDHVPINAAEIIQEVLDMLATEWQRHEIELHVHVPLELPWILGTRVELQQVFFNLFTNTIEALAHLKKGKRRKLKVEGSCRRMNDARVLFFVVQDSGPGFPDDHQERLFDAFFTTKSEGLGMGLAVSRSIVRRHGGELRARNTPKGPRFEFFVRLPEQALT
jgi:PAS domain S-box-containing protein